MLHEEVLKIPSSCNIPCLAFEIKLNKFPVLTRLQTIETGRLLCHYLAFSLAAAAKTSSATGSTLRPVLAIKISREASSCLMESK